MILAALLVSIIALALAIVALPTVFQMFFGRPQLRIVFEETDIDIGRRLECRIYNVAVQNRILKLIGVRRDQAVISTTFCVREAGSNVVLFDTARAYLIDIGGYPYLARAGCATGAGDRRTRLAPPSMVPVLS